MKRFAGLSLVPASQFVARVSLLFVFVVIVNLELIISCICGFCYVISDVIVHI